MRPPTSDPTAGERARSIRAHPGIPHALVDPTDPHYGTFPSDAAHETDELPYRFDPTSPANGELMRSVRRR